MVAKTTFEMVGGMETFHKLAEAFYRRVETDPLLRPMYPQSLHNSTEMLALFLAQYFGGPTEYSALRGHPRLRMRHVGFRIGLAERDAWLSHMLAAVEEIGVEEPNRSLMNQYFKQASEFLINMPEG